MKRVQLYPLIFSIVFFLIFPFRLIQVISVLIMFIYLISYLLSKYIYRSISISRVKSVYYCQNGADEFSELVINNRGNLLLDNLIINDKGSGAYNSGDGIFIDSIGRKRSKTLRAKLNCETRGRYKIGPVVITGSDPFNLFPWSRTFENYSDVFIYPKYSPIELLMTKGDIGGRQKVKDKLYEDLLQLESMREYRQGDSLKKVNWKATARTGTLFTMEYSNSLSAPLFVLLDIDPENYPLKHRYVNIERSIELVSSLTTSYGDRLESRGLYMNSSRDGVLIPNGQGYDHTISILEKLSEIDFLYISKQPLINGFINSGGRVPGGAHIYIVVPRITKKLINEISLLKSNNSIINIVNTGGEREEYCIPNYCNYFRLTPFGKEYLDDIK